MTPPDASPKVKLVYGPSRTLAEECLPAEYGTNWGLSDPRDGKSLRQLRSELEEELPPPPYSKH